MGIGESEGNQRNWGRFDGNAGWRACRKFKISIDSGSKRLPGGSENRLSTSLFVQPRRDLDIFRIFSNSSILKGPFAFDFIFYFQLVCILIIGTTADRLVDLATPYLRWGPGSLPQNHFRILVSQQARNPSGRQLNNLEKFPLLHLDNRNLGRPRCSLFCILIIGTTADRRWARSCRKCCSGFPNL